MRHQDLGQSGRAGEVGFSAARDLLLEGARGRRYIFTGADKAASGLIAQAHGGILFLDEVGELPESMQKAFLRVLQERSFRPIGGKREIESDFRLVAATNRDLEEMVQQGKFRQALFFRFHSLVINQ